MSGKGLVRKGYLTKKGGSFKSKKKRWFVLTDEVMTYFENDTESKPLGSIPLSEVTKCEVVGSKDISIKTPYRDYEISADQLSEAIEWIEDIEARIKILKANKDIIKQQGSPVQNKTIPLAIKKEQAKLSGEAEELKLLLENERKSNEELVNENRNNAKTIQELNNRVEAKDQQITALKEQLEQRYFNIRNLEDEVAAAKNAQIEFSKKSATDQDIMKKWDADVQDLKKSRHEYMAVMEENVSLKAQLNVSNQRIVRAQEKLQKIRSALV